MKLQNKLLIIFILIALFLCLSSKVFAANTVPVVGIEDDELFELIYATEEYTSGDYYLIIGRNDVTYYKIIFVRKSDNPQFYIDSYSGGSYWIYYSNSCHIVAYKSSKNPTSLTKMYSKNDVKDLLYNSNSGEFFSNVNIYDDNTYTNYFFQSPLAVTQTLEMMGETVQFQTPLLEILGLLPLTIVVVASLVGFRKAFLQLEIFFHRS